MLKVSLLEFCLRGLPESLLFVWAINFINMKKINKKIWILLSLFLTTIIYIVRLLPIQYGVNTLIAISILIASAHYISKLPLIESISSSLIVVTSLCICEFINVIVLMYFFKVTIQEMTNMPLQKILILFPSLILFIFFILILNSFNKKAL